MDILRRIIGAATLVAVVFLGGSALYLKTYGRTIVEEQITRVLRRPAAIGVVKFDFPLSLRVEGMTIAGLLSAREVIAQYDLIGLMRHHSHLARVRLREPVMTLRRRPDGQLSFGETPPAIFSPGDASQAVTNRREAVVLDYLDVTGGQLEIVDERAERPFKMTLKNVRISAWRVPLSAQPRDTQLVFSALIAEGTLPLVGCRVDGQGWFNWFARDMNASVRLTDAAQEWELKTKLQSVHNALAVTGNMRLTPRATTGEDSRPDSLVSLAKGILAVTGTDMDCDFSFSTTMDRPEVNDVTFSGKVNRPDVAGVKPAVVNDLRNIGKQLEAYHKNMRIRQGARGR